MVAWLCLLCAFCDGYIIIGFGMGVKGFCGVRTMDSQCVYMCICLWWIFVSESRKTRKTRRRGIRLVKMFFEMDTRKAFTLNAFLSEPRFSGLVDFQDCEFAYSACQSKDRCSSLNRNVEDTKSYRRNYIIL